jgi:4-hydroxybenzoate polyprenyltransferase
MTLRAHLQGVWALTHPGPSLITAVAYVLCVLIAARGKPDVTRLVVTVLGMICMQFAISALNDYRDREADARSQHKRKPIVQGLVTPNFALSLALALAVAMEVLYAPYGIVPALTATAFLALGFAYDLGVKTTPFSGVMLGLAFPIIPLLAWELFATVKPALFWTFAIGMALGLSIHLADALPDVQADSAAGVRGLTQMLGRNALVACWGLLALAEVLIVALALSHATTARLAILIPALAVATFLLLGAILSFQRQALPELARLRFNFAWVVGSALVIACGWLASAVV